jgi:Zn-dependent M28 family amino/carboxypeptidase
MRLLLAAASVLALATPATAQSLADTAATLRDRATAGSPAYPVLESLTTEIGARPAGSPAQKRAMEWGVAKLKALGFQNVHTEPFTITAWVRGAESAEVTGPYPQHLAILGLGGTVPTPAGGIEAQIALFRTYADFLAAPEGSLKGKIAVVTEPMVRTQDGSGYGAANAIRTQGPAQAARRGAVAYLCRSLATNENRLPHTGATRYAEGVAKIPAAALSVVDAELLDRMAARGKPVRIKLSLDSHTVLNAPAWNVVGEVTGRETPDQVIVVGGHLDSWDPGTGAIDDGAGVAIEVGAAKLINDLPKHPRRTIRVVMWGSEEMGGSGEAYAAAHKAEAPKIVLAGESDEGADPIWSLALPAGSADHPAMKTVANVIAPLKIYVDRAPSRFGGSDTEGLLFMGVPVVDYHQDATHYFDLHHSADDTLDKVDRAKLDQNVAAWAVLLYAAAESDLDFRPKPAVKP